VAHRVTVRLIQQLDLASDAEAIDDEAVQRYTTLYKKPLNKQALGALRRVTKLDEAPVMATAMALAAAEEEARLAA